MLGQRVLAWEQGSVRDYRDNQTLSRENVVVGQEIQFANLLLADVENFCAIDTSVSPDWTLYWIVPILRRSVPGSAASVASCHRRGGRVDGFDHWFGAGWMCGGAGRRCQRCIGSRCGIGGRTITRITRRNQHDKQNDDDQSKLSKLGSSTISRHRASTSLCSVGYAKCNNYRRSPKSFRGSQRLRATLCLSDFVVRLGLVVTSIISDAMIAHSRMKSQIAAR